MRESIDERAKGLEIDLQELLMMYLRKWWIIFLALVVCASVSLGYTWKFETPMYRARATIYVNNSNSAEDKEYVTNSDLNAAQTLVNTYVDIVTSYRVLDPVAERLNGRYTSSQLRGMVSASRINETGILGVYVVSADPEAARDIANEVVDEVPVAIADVVDGSSAEVIDYARLPQGRYSPSYSRAALTGAVIGVVLAIAALTVFHLKDTRVKDENDLTNLFDLPVLGRIPNFAFLNTGSKYGYSASGYGTSEEKKEAGENDL